MKAHHSGVLPCIDSRSIVSIEFWTLDGAISRGKGVMARMPAALPAASANRRWLAAQRHPFLFSKAARRFQRPAGPGWLAPKGVVRGWPLPPAPGAPSTRRGLTTGWLRRDAKKG